MSNQPLFPKIAGESKRSPVYNNTSSHLDASALIAGSPVRINIRCMQKKVDVI